MKKYRNRESKIYTINDLPEYAEDFGNYVFYVDSLETLDKLIQEEEYVRVGLYYDYYPTYPGSDSYITPEYKFIRVTEEHPFGGIHKVGSFIFSSYDKTTVISYIERTFKQLNKIPVRFVGSTFLILRNLEEVNMLEKFEGKKMDYLQY